MPDTLRLPRLLDGDFLEARRLKPTAYSLALNRRAASEAEITQAKEDEELPLRAFAELYLRRGSAGIFRVAERKRAVAGENSRSYTLRHAICTLHDSLWRDQEDFSGTVTAFLTKLLSFQTTVYWQLGTVSDTGNWKRSGINYDHLDDLLWELANDRQDYLFTFDFSTSPWTLNFAAASGTVDCEMREKRNLYDGQKRDSIDGMCNKLYLTVHSSEESDGDSSETEPTITIYQDAASQADNGVIEGTANIDTADVPDVSAWVAAFFRDHAAPLSQTSADGYEIVKSTGEPFDQFDLGKKCRVPALSAEGPVESIRFSDLLGNPDKARVDLNRKLPRFSESLAQARETARKAYSAARGASREQRRLYLHFEDEVGNLSSTIAADAESLRTEFLDSANSMRSMILQTASQIRSEVSDGMNSVHSSISQTASQIRSEVASGMNSVRSSITQESDRIMAEVEDSANSVRSLVTQTASGLRSEISDANSRISAVEQTASTWRAEIQNSISNVWSVIETWEGGGAIEVRQGNNVYTQWDNPATTQGITVIDGDVWIRESDQGTWGQKMAGDWDSSQVFQWADSMGREIYVRRGGEWHLVMSEKDLVIQGARFEVTQNEIWGVVDDNQNSLRAEMSMTASRFYRHMTDGITGMESLITQTASQIRTEVSDSANSVRSTITQTANQISLEVGKRNRVFVQWADPQTTLTSADAPLTAGDIWVKHNDMRTWNQAGGSSWQDSSQYDWTDYRRCEQYVWRGVARGWELITSEKDTVVDAARLQVEQDEIWAVVDDNENRLRAEMSMTASQFYRNMTDGIAGVESLVYQTASVIRSEVTDSVNGVSSTLSQTASQIRAEVRDSANSVRSLISQTASQIRSEVEDSANSVRSLISQTASQIRSEVVNSANSVRSLISQTASQIRSEVVNSANSVRSYIQQQADRIDIVVSASGSIKPAAIVSAINGAGSSVIISADHIDLDGYVTMSDLNAVSAEIDKLIAGQTVATSLKATYLEATNTLTVGQNGYKACLLYYGSGSSQVSWGTVLGTSSGGINVNHYHAITATEGTGSNAGKITLTLGAVRNSQGTANFNIADTQFFRDSVAAVNVESQSAWESLSSGTVGRKVITLTNGNTINVYIPDASEHSSAKIGDKLYSLSCKIGGRVFTFSDIDTTGSYEAGAASAVPTGSSIWLGVAGTPGDTRSSTPPDTAGNASRSVGIWYQQSNGEWLCLRNGTVYYTDNGADLTSVGRVVLYKKVNDEYQDLGRHNWYYTN